MAKRNRMPKVEARLKEGRGKGEGVDYKPWLTIHDVPSRGTVSRVNGWKTNRIHHLMSQNELWYFYLLEWSPYVVDIREQFPLLPLERTLEIAESLGLKHPTDPSTKEPIVMTTDFLVTVQTNRGKKLLARTIKPERSLGQREIEKFKIEHQFYYEQGIDWGITVDTDIPQALAKNIEWIHDAYDAVVLNVDVSVVNRVSPRLFDVLSSTVRPFSTELLEQDEILGFEDGTCLSIARHMLAQKRWSVDMESEKLNFNQPMDITLGSSFNGSSVTGGARR